MVNEALKIAKLAFLPSVAISPQGTLSSFDGAAATKSYTLPVSASWNVDLSAHCYKGLSDCSEMQHHLWYSQLILHSPDA